MLQSLQAILGCLLVAITSIVSVLRLQVRRRQSTEIQRSIELTFQTAKLSEKMKLNSEIPDKTIFFGERKPKNDHQVCGPRKDSLKG